MDLDPDYYLKLLLDSGLTKEKIDEEIKKKKEEYGDLLTDEGALYSLVLEKGLLDKNIKISELLQGAKGIIEVKVLKKFENKPPVVFFLSDDTGECKAACWDQEISQKIKVGDRIRLRNFRTKTWQGELQIQIDKNTNVEILDKKESLIEEFQKEFIVVKVFPKKAYSKGEYKSIILSSEGKEVRAVLWNSQASVNLLPGMVVSFEDINWRNNEIHVNEKSKIKIVKMPNVNSPDLIPPEGKAVLFGTFEAPNLYFFEICALCERAFKNGKCMFCQSTQSKKSAIVVGNLLTEKGMIKIKIFRAEKILDIPLESIEETLKKFEGMKMYFFGELRKNAYFGDEEFIVQNVYR
ncbi:MAG: hypothetical protein QXK00_01260 [archaeon]